MNLAQRLELALPMFPLALRAFYHAEIEAGNELRDVELGVGPDKGKAAIVLYKKFLTKPGGLKYRARRDRNPMTFEYHSPDDCFSVLWVKFKPMKFEKITGPKNPTVDHIKAMKKRARQEEAAARKRAKLAAKEEAKATRERERAEKRARKNAARGDRPAAPAVSPNDLERLAMRQPRTPLPPLLPIVNAGLDAQKFLASMQLTYDQWHDGEGYDLATLDKLTGKDRDAVESVLIHHQPRDWRDIEALARLNTPAAKSVVEESLRSYDPVVRAEAMKHAGGKLPLDERERLLIHALETADFYAGLSQAINEACEFHPPAVIDALLRCTLDRDGGIASHFAALLYYLHGKAKSPFDWDHRPFFLRFNTGDRAERMSVFLELCETLGIDSKKYTR